VSEERYKSLKEFYPFYLKEHLNPTCRKLHFTGTSLFFVALALWFYTGNGYFGLAAPVAGYGFAWVGHFFFEQNKPATFRYPLYSLLSDFKLYFEIWAGKERFNPGT
jgi:hypothetical protein